MTAKEKADQLIKRYSIFISMDSVYRIEWVSPVDEEANKRLLKDAKALSISTVDEITQSLRYTEAKSDSGYIGFWNNVKKELQKIK